VARGERTGTVKAASRIKKIEKILEREPERRETLGPLLDSLKKRLLDAKCCLGCGRPLTDPESQERGYGSECWRRANDNG
jgi:hypothetical protein